eukprot:367338_1
MFNFFIAITSITQFGRQLTSATTFSTSNTTLPLATSSAACGFFENSFFIIGGEQYPRQLTEFDVQNNIMNLWGTVVSTSVAVHGNQFYTQINNILYMLDPSGYKLHTFNLQSKSFINHWNNITIPIDVGDYRSCLTSTDNYLFIVGGGTGNYGAMSTVQILEIDSLMWLNNIPSMNYKRRLSSCNFNKNNQKLFAIGGWTGNARTKSIELLHNFFNCSSTSWRTIADTLSIAINGQASVLYDNYIIVMGGRTGPQRVDEVYIINTITETVTMRGYMDYPVSGAATRLVNNMIYVFGGTSSSAVDTWQYADALLLLNVTQSLNNDSISYSTSLSASCYYPTKLPSIYPTQVPLECIDYNTQSISNDGKDVISNMTFVPEINELFSNISEINATIEYHKNIQFEETKRCYSNVSVCYIDCTESRSCALSSVEIYHMNMEHLIIRCQDTASCYSLTVRFINASMKTVNILCSDIKSCSLMRINAWNISVDSLHIHCDGEHACLNMKLQITAT